MRWFVFIDGKIYGPYTREQMSPFLTAETKVAREGQQTWIGASEDPELADVLSGQVQPVMEWHVARPGKPFRGPFIRSALMAMIERKEVEPKDLILHASWSEAMPLGQTRLYAKWVDPAANLDDFSPEQILDAPRPKSENAPPPPKIRFTRPELPKGGLAFVSVALAVILGYSYYVIAQTDRGMNTHPLVQACGGEASGPCRTDAISRCLCQSRPEMCGCAEKGDCGMMPCQKYKAQAPSPDASKYLRRGPAPPR